MVAPLLLSVLLLGPALAQSPGPVAEKQQVLWQKLESSITGIDHHLDGVMGIAILDLTD